jgi:hypothetical protein
MIDEDSLQERKAAILPHLDERQRRLFAAARRRFWLTPNLSRLIPGSGVMQQGWASAKVGGASK